MVSLAGEKLVQFVDGHQPSFQAAWDDFYRHLSNTSPQSIPDFIYAACTQQGLSTRYLAGANALCYGEHTSTAQETLLLCTSYHASAPNLAQSAAIFACLSALTVYQTCTGAPPITLKWLCGSQDALLHDSLAQQSHLLQADGCIWYETGSCLADGSEIALPRLAAGAKGLLRVELTVQSSQHAFPASYGTILPNAAWRLLWALNSLKDAREDMLIEGFYDTLVPFDDQAIALLAALPDNAPALAERAGTAQLLFALSGFRQHYAHLLTPTCNVLNFSSENGVSAGLLSALMPTQARAEIDFHLVPQQQPADIYTKLQHHLQTQGFSDIQLRQLYAAGPSYTSISDPFVQMVQQATHSAYGQAPLLLPIIAEHIPLATIGQNTQMPFVIVNTPETQVADEPGQLQGLIAMIKQLLLSIEGMRTLV